MNKSNIVNDTTNGRSIQFSLFLRNIDNILIVKKLTISNNFHNSFSTLLYSTLLYFTFSTLSFINFLKPLKQSFEKS